VCLMLMTKTRSEFLRKRAPLRREEETPDDEKFFANKYVKEYKVQFT